LAETIEKKSDVFLRKIGIKSEARNAAK